MNVLNKIINYFKKPKWYILLITYVLTIFCIMLTLFLIINNYNEEIYNYILYILAAILLSYSIYTIIINIKHLKVTIINIFKKTEFGNNILENYNFRTIIFSILSFIFGCCYAIYIAAVGILDSSIWFGALAAYYLILSLIKGRNLLILYKKKDTEEKDKIFNKIKMYKESGYLLIFLTFIFSFAVIQMLFNNKSFLHMGYFIYIAALYSFYKISLAIFNIFKARKNKDYAIQTIRNINFAGALISIVALQSAMFTSFGSGINENIYNGITGGIVCLFIIIIGSMMLIKGNVEKKNYEKEIEK